MSEHIFQEDLFTPSLDIGFSKRDLDGIYLNHLLVAACNAEREGFIETGAVLIELLAKAMASDERLR